MGLLSRETRGEMNLNKRWSFFTGWFPCTAPTPSYKPTKSSANLKALAIIKCLSFADVNFNICCMNFAVVLPCSGGETFWNIHGDSISINKRSVGGIPNSKEVCICKVYTLITTFSLPKHCGKVQKYTCKVQQVYFQCPKVHFESTKIYLQSTKCYFQIVHTFKVQKYTFQVQKYTFQVRAGALRPIKSPKGTSTPWPQSFQGRHINIPKGTSIQRNPHGHGPMCWCRVTSYNTLKSILSYGKYVTKPT